MDDTPLSNLKLTPSQFLRELDKRTPCSNCHRSRKFYCYSCILALPATEDKIPKVKLPIKVDVIKHPNECDGKSTAVHAAIIASGDVKIYTYPVIPDYCKSDKVVLVYPGEKAISLSELKDIDHSATFGQSVTSYDNRSTDQMKDNNDKTASGISSSLSEAGNKQQKYGACHEKDQESETRLCDESTSSGKRSSDNSEEGSSKRMKFTQSSFDRVVFIDSTWSQTKKIYDDERIKDLPQVKLNTHKTIFWRHQKDKPDTYLATIEAIYYFLREYHEQFIDEDYDGQYDDLLFFFCFFYKQTRELYESGRNIKAYKDRENRGIMK